MRPVAISALLFCALDPLSASVLAKTARIGKTTVHYKVVLPEPFDASKAYPGVLAFSGGPQTMTTVDGAIARNWREQAEKRGYIVAIPAAPDDQLFFEEGARVFPEFVTRFLAEYKIQDGKLHIAGVSNGGIGAFHIAALYPQFFLSIAGCPGYLPDATSARLQAISKMCVNLYAGRLDEGWAEAMEKQSSGFRSAGMTVHFSVEKGQPYRIDTLAGAGASRLFDFFEESRKGCGIR